MFDTDQDLIRHSLHQWANHIETGSVTYSKNDVAHMIQTCKPNTADSKRLMKMVKPLKPEQVAFVQRIRDLAEKQ